MAVSNLQRSRNLVLICIYLLFALSAIRNAMFGIWRLADLAVALAISIAMVQFCIVDSRCRGKPLLHSFYWIIFFSWPFSVPVYWLWTRGIRGIIWAVLFVISLEAVYITVLVATGYLVWGAPWLQRLAETFNY